VLFAFLEEPPFCFTDAAGAVSGCDVELASAVCDRLGLPFEPVEGEFADLLPGLADGLWTMTTGLFVSGDRKRLAGFSRPIRALADGLLVAEGNPLGLAGYRSIAEDHAALLAVITDQVQGQTALENGVPADRIGRGVELGMVSLFANDGVPKYVWSVDEDGEVYEAKIKPAQKTEYHGYRLGDDDAAMRAYVLKEWKVRCRRP
jgi:ABC-type amino acid transport substrate-binding protein